MLCVVCASSAKACTKWISNRFTVQMLAFTIMVMAPGNYHRLAPLIPTQVEFPVAYISTFAQRPFVCICFGRILPCRRVNDLEPKSVEIVYIKHCGIQLCSLVVCRIFTDIVQWLSAHSLDVSCIFISLAGRPKFIHPHTRVQVHHPMCVAKWIRVTSAMQCACVCAVHILYAL